MSTLSAIQKAAKKQADSITDGAVKTVESMDASYQSLFPFKTLSEATASFSAGDVAKPNEALAKAVSAAQEAVDSTVTACLTMERYILLTIPQMEDGGNFGVTVQLAGLKMVKDDREKLEKMLEDLSKYASSRADALEKLKLPSSSKSKTTTSTTANNETKGGEKPGATSSTGSNTEEKTVETENQLADAPFRQQAVWQVDALYYSKARNAFMSAMTCFMTAADFLDKNKGKIAAPKGSSGGRGFSSMY
ncbi:proteasome (prosome, macropain) activator subunit [Seminavis robusta]|uniref:Proteasome (Prosome, macropain) activator subunit n=1 Tax=Seminavis robusta TaxID=568900 RepID=A0A9N8EEP8_9STRA|nr:proteasome (prosome, macropain) activator subunit [Seminavis robusta]|eukprot:Sro828_g208010.1 proteasome (prosome, macropain) activator subunit (249) ;mRNA; f:37709-38561